MANPVAPDVTANALRVLMASTSYPANRDDWKGRFIYDLCNALGKRADVALYLWAPHGDLPAGVHTANADDARWLADMLALGGIAHLLRTRPLSGLSFASGILRRLRRAGRVASPQLYHLNWLQLALGVPADRRPLYISVLGTDFKLLGLPGMKTLIRHTFRHRPVMLAPNAGWMVEPLSEAFGTCAEISANPFGVDDAWFEAARRAPTLPTWLVVSRVTRDKLGDLLAWGEGLFGPSRRLILLGPRQEQFELPSWIDYQGPTNPEALRGRWFPEATGLLTLSRHAEGRPQVMIEAMAAGLPVVASHIPAHDDLLIDGETGHLPGSPVELRDALEASEQAEIGTRIGNHARMWTQENIGTWDDHARRCLGHYRRLLVQENASHVG